MWKIIAINFIKIKFITREYGYMKSLHSDFKVSRKMAFKNALLLNFKKKYTSDWEEFWKRCSTIYDRKGGGRGRTEVDSDISPFISEV